MSDPRARERRRKNERRRAERRRERAERHPWLLRCVDAGVLTPEQARDVRLHLDRGCSRANAIALAARGWGPGWAARLGDDARFAEHMASLAHDDPATARRIDELADDIHAGWVAAE